jgi:hypothetical protein
MMLLILVFNLKFAKVYIGRVANELFIICFRLYMWLYKTLFSL